MGTGTAYLKASRGEVEHIIGSGVGGGTIVGLCNSMVGIDDPMILSDSSLMADLRRVDLTIGDISKKEIPGLPMNVTASNFGKAADDLTREEKVAGIFNLVYQSIGTMAVLSAREVGIDKIVLTGQLAAMPQAKTTFDLFSSLYNKKFILPDDAEFATAIGACLAGARD